MVKAGTVSAGDLKLFLVTDDMDEAIAHIQRYAIEPFGLRRRVLKPSPLLGERAPNRGRFAAVAASSMAEAIDLRLIQQSDRRGTPAEVARAVASDEPTKVVDAGRSRRRSRTHGSIGVDGRKVPDVELLVPVGEADPDRSRDEILHVGGQAAPGRGHRRAAE